MGLFDKLLGKKQEPVVKVPLTQTLNRGAGFLAEEIPPLQGDYAKAIFLFANSKPSTVKKDDGYQRYLIYECGIRQPAHYHRSLIKDGFFVESNLPSLVAALKVQELRDILLQLGETTTGKKDMLIQRILDNGNETIIRQYCPQGTYMLSDKGRACLADHDDYVKLHQHKNWGITWQEYDSAYRLGRSFFETVWDIFNAHLLKSNRIERNIYLYMAELLIETGNRQHAIEVLLQVLYLDISGSCNYDYLMMYRHGVFDKKDARSSFEVAIMIAPWVQESIAAHKDVYTDNLIPHIYQWKLPIQVCSEQLFRKIVDSIMDGTYSEEVTMASLKKAYYAYIDTMR